MCSQAMIQLLDWFPTRLQGATKAMRPHWGTDIRRRPKTKCTVVRLLVLWCTFKRFLWFALILSFITV